MNPQSLIWVAIEWRSVCGMASAMWGSPLRAPMGGVKPLPYIQAGRYDRKLKTHCVAQATVWRAAVRHTGKSSSLERRSRMQFQVVLHYADGRLLKGHATDFFPNKETFHMTVRGSDESHEIRVADLKGVFFVRTFDGNPTRNERKDMERSGMGKRIQVKFKDGEELIGYTSGYSPDRPGFFVFPADPESNNEKIFVVTAATANVAFS